MVTYYFRTYEDVNTKLFLNFSGIDRQVSEVLDATLTKVKCLRQEKLLKRSRLPKSRGNLMKVKKVNLQNLQSSRSK